VSCKKITAKACMPASQSVSQSGQSGQSRSSHPPEAAAAPRPSGGSARAGMNPSVRFESAWPLLPPPRLVLVLSKNKLLFCVGRLLRARGLCSRLRLVCLYFVNVSVRLVPCRWAK
jgi:hypothetical protein